MKIAVIPARGGSKRIPRKNIKLFHGKPMIAYSIEAAIRSNCFDSVLVSTDDLEIAEIAKEYGAIVPFIRPAEIADDYATTLDVMAHALTWLNDHGTNAAYVCCLYATAPFVQSDDIKCALTMLEGSHADYVFSATTYAFPIQRAISLSEDNDVAMFSPEYEQVRSQDLVDAYHDAGQFYWGRTDAFKQKLPIFTSNSKAIILPRARVQDIDTPEDWDLAERLYTAMKA